MAANIYGEPDKNIGKKGTTDSGGGIGGAIGRVLGFDVTPGFNLSKSGISASGQTAPIGTKTNLKTPVGVNFDLTGVPQATQATAPSSGASSAASAAAAREAAQLGSLRGDSRNLISQIMAVYDALFGGLDNVARSRGADVEKQYGDQLDSTTKSYVGSIPEIEKSYAAIGAGDSTDQADAKDTAKEGFDTATKTIQKNKDDDLAAIGNYVAGQQAKWNADRGSVNRLSSRLDSTSDVGDLTDARNELETKLGSVQSDQGGLLTDQGARGTLSNITADNGRFDSVKNALDGIVKGSMSGAVKQAAVEAVTSAAGLNDEDKQKVKALYGNVYDTPVVA